MSAERMQAGAGCNLDLEGKFVLEASFLSEKGTFFDLKRGAPAPEQIRIASECFSFYVNGVSASLFVSKPQ